VLVVATHSETEGHDTAVTTPLDAIEALLQELAPPVGLGDVRIVSPPPRVAPAPAATHSAVDGQETALMTASGSTVVFAHAFAPPVGSVDMRMSPAESPATHSEVVGRETPWIH
jgi:hypothetical protein